MARTPAVSATPNPIHYILDLLREFCRRLDVCHDADDRATRTDSLKVWHQFTYPFWSTYKRPNEAVHQLGDPALAWLTNHKFRKSEFTATVLEGARMVVLLAMHRPVAMPEVYANENEARSHWENQLQLFDAVWTIQDKLRSVAAQTGHVWTERESTSTVGQVEPISVDHPSRSPAKSNGDGQSSPSAASKAISPLHPDGPEPPYWFWWQGERCRIGRGRSRRPWQLLNYMWGIESATFHELQGAGKPWADDVGPTTFSATANRVNLFLPHGLPRQLGIHHHCVIWKTRKSQRNHKK